MAANVRNPREPLLSNDELLAQVFSYLDTGDIVNINKTCRQFHEIMQSTPLKDKLQMTYVISDIAKKCHEKNLFPSNIGNGENIHDRLIQAIAAADTQGITEFFLEYFELVQKQSQEFEGYKQAKAHLEAPKIYELRLYRRAFNWHTLKKNYPLVQPLCENNPKYIEYFQVIENLILGKIVGIDSLSSIIPILRMLSLLDCKDTVLYENITENLQRLHYFASQDPSYQIRLATLLVEIITNPDSMPTLERRDFLPVLKCLYCMECDDEDLYKSIYENIKSIPNALPDHLKNAFFEDNNARIIHIDPTDIKTYHDYMINPGLLQLEIFLKTTQGDDLPLDILRQIVLSIPDSKVATLQENTLTRLALSCYKQDILPSPPVEKCYCEAEECDCNEDHLLIAEKLEILINLFSPLQMQYIPGENVFIYQTPPQKDIASQFAQALGELTEEVIEYLESFDVNSTLREQLPDSSTTRYFQQIFNQYQFHTHVSLLQSEQVHMQTMYNLVTGQLGIDDLDEYTIEQSINGLKLISCNDRELRGMLHTKLGTLLHK